MPGKHERWLQKTRFVLTLTAFALVVIFYGISHFFTS
jgi:hypothetical protein